MITFYLFGLGTGGALLVLSLAGGGDDHADDAEIEVEADAADAHDGEAGHPLAVAALPIASLRFWTFFLAFGGLTGTLLTWLGTVGRTATALLAAVAGYGAGIGVSAFTRWLGRSQVTSTLERGDCLGATGTVLLPVARGTRGRIRVELESQNVDFDAETEDEVSLRDAEAVVVYAVRDDGVVLVTAADRTPTTDWKGKDT